MADKFFVPLCDYLRLYLSDTTEMTSTDKKNIQQPEEGAKTRTPAAKKWPVWISLVLAVLSWMVLMILKDDYSGYIALALGVAAVVAGFRGAFINERSLRRLAITAIIAAGVLVVVLASVIGVMKICTTVS